MSSRHDRQDDDRTGYARIVREAKEQAFHARRALRRDLPAPSFETKREVAETAADFYDILEDYHDENALTGEFGERVPVSPHDLLARTVQIDRAVETSQNPAASKARDVPAVADADPASLLRLSKELDAIAKDLGFAASVTDSRPLYDAGKQDNYPDPVVEGIPKPLRGSDSGDINGFRYSKLYHDWYKRVACGDPNDYVIAISADPRSTGVSGTGKTTLGGGLVKRWFDHSDGGFDAEQQYTLDPAVLGYEMYDRTGELAALVGDEMQGTPATTGLNSKRSQKNESLDTINAIAAGRSDRKTVILIVQDLKSLNKDALTFVDAWLLIRDDFDYVATHYAVAPDVFDLGSRQTKTPGIEELTWDALPADDPDYQVMEQKKEQAKQGKREYSDDDGEGDGGQMTIPKPARDAKIRELAKAGVSQSAIAEAMGLTQGTVSKIVNNNE